MEEMDIDSAASDSDRLESLKILIGGPAEPARYDTRELVIACGAGNSPAVEFLVNREVPVDKCDNNHNT